MSGGGGIIGISDHGGWAVLVAASRDGALLDRRRVELIDDDLPALPHHHEGQGLSIDEAIALVERVRASAEVHARRALDSVAMAGKPIAGIALRKRQTLPPTIAERLADYRARNVADWVMYREALAAAAAQRSWPVYWYDPKTVFDAASRALGVANFELHALHLRKTVGPPWNKDHHMAMAAAVAAAARS